MSQKYWRKSSSAYISQDIRIVIIVVILDCDAISSLNLLTRVKLGKCLHKMRMVLLDVVGLPRRKRPGNSAKHQSEK